MPCTVTREPARLACLLPMALSPTAPASRRWNWHQQMQQMAMERYTYTMGQCNAWGQSHASVRLVMIHKAFPMTQHVFQNPRDPFSLTARLRIICSAYPSFHLADVIQSTSKHFSELRVPVSHISFGHSGQDMFAVHKHASHLICSDLVMHGNGMTKV